ncbi:MAG: SDR family oxidoreductase [Pseudomonadota bacterium]
MSLFDLSNNIVIVTGASRGIGEAIARRAAEHGANVVVSSRKQDACEAVAADINAKEGREAAIAVACNISYKEQLQALVDATHEKWGRVDTLVCNAAVNPYFGPSKDISDEQFDKIMATNVRSNHWLCHMVLPGMAERNHGSIVILSSIGGMTGSSMLGVYGLSKAADFQLARNLAIEYGPHNVRANCIAPGIIKTHFAEALWKDPEIEKTYTQRLPLRRFGEPDDIAGAAVFLASKAGAFMTGQSLVIDGGTLVGLEGV